MAGRIVTIQLPVEMATYRCLSSELRLHERMYKMLMPRHQFADYSALFQFVSDDQHYLTGMQSQASLADIKSTY